MDILLTSIVGVLHGNDYQCALTSSFYNWEMSPQYDNMTKLHYVDSVKDKQKTLTDIDKSKQEISDLKQCYNVYIEDLEINQDFPKKSKK